VEAAAGGARETLRSRKEKKNRELQENNGWTLTCHLGLGLGWLDWANLDQWKRKGNRGKELGWAK